MVLLIQIPFASVKSCLVTSGRNKSKIHTNYLELQFVHAYIWLEYKALYSSLDDHKKTGLSLCGGQCRLAQTIINDQESLPAGKALIMSRFGLGVVPILRTCSCFSNPLKYQLIICLKTYYLVHALNSFATTVKL